VGCGESPAEIYCEGFGTCWDKVSSGGSVSQGSVDECVDNVDEWLDGLSESDRKAAEEPVEECADYEACAFVVCFCDASGYDDEICNAAAQHL
jgi:hypothetical protein